MDKPYLGKWISVLYRIGQGYFDQQMGQYGIGGAHVSILLCLYREEGVTQDSLRKSLNVDKATIARTIASLENIGYIIREKDLNDKRANKVFLTERGKALEPKILAVLKKWACIITANFTPEEKEISYNLLQRMAVNAITLRLPIQKLDSDDSPERERSLYYERPVN